MPAGTYQLAGEDGFKLAELTELIAAIGVGIARRGLHRERALSRLIGRPTTPIREYVSQVVGGERD